MHVSKLRIEGNGLVPAGRYFARLAQSLEDANDRDAERRERLDNEDRRLEARYRRASAARSGAVLEHAGAH